MVSVGCLAVTARLSVKCNKEESTTPTSTLGFKKIRKKNSVMAGSIAVNLAVVWEGGAEVGLSKLAGRH